MLRIIYGLAVIVGTTDLAISKEIIEILTKHNGRTKAQRQ